MVLKLFPIVSVVKIITFYNSMKKNSYLELAQGNRLFKEKVASVRRDIHAVDRITAF